MGSYRDLQATDADWTEGIFTVAAVIELPYQQSNLEWNLVLGRWDLLSLKQSYYRKKYYGRLVFRLLMTTGVRILTSA
jgi:hypothetical protein